MKYTRYDIKRKNKDNFTLAVVLISVLIASYLLGTALSSMFIKNAKKPGSEVQTQNSSANSQVNPKDNIQVKTENISVKFICIQNGLFENKDNAEILKNRVKELLNPFTIKEESKMRILSGIFKEPEAARQVQLLNEKDIPNALIKFELNKSDKSDAEIIEIINGYLEVLTRLIDKNVKSIQTDSFKQYTKSLEKVESTSKNYAVLEELKKHVDSLPEAIVKEKTEECYIYLYGILKKVGTGKN